MIKLKYKLHYEYRQKILLFVLSGLFAFLIVEK